jgi:hypothetical protein
MDTETKSKCAKCEERRKKAAAALAALLDRVKRGAKE